MGENGRRAILEKYNWEIESMKLLQIYEEIKKVKINNALFVSIIISFLKCNFPFMG